MERLAALCTGLLVLLSLISAGSAISCYDCNSKFDPNCADDHFAASTLGTVNCSHLERPHLDGMEANYCRKVTQFVQNHTRVVRSCGWLEDWRAMQPGCYKRTGTKDIMVTFCACSSDDCNSAPGSKGLHHLPALVLGLMAVALQAF